MLRGSSARASSAALQNMAGTQQWTSLEVHKGDEQPQRCAGLASSKTLARSKKKSSSAYASYSQSGAQTVRKKFPHSAFA